MEFKGIKEAEDWFMKEHGINKIEDISVLFPKAKLFVSRRMDETFYTYWR
jgi:hypothetical protein